MSTDHSQNQRLIESERRLIAIEYNLRRLMAITKVEWQEPPPSNDLPPEVLEALAAGDKMRAMQELVRRLGVSLTEAKAIAERGRR